jgi:magnesium and cobalt exporter, CNNM family
MIAGWWLIAGLALASLAGIFASLVLSLHTLSRMRIASLLQDLEHDQAEQRVRAILDDVPGHAAALAFIRQLLRYATGLSFVFWASGMRAEQSPSITSIIIGLLIAAGVLWIISTLIPMGIALHAGEAAVIRLSLLIRALHILFVPVLPLWRFINEVVRRLAGNTQDTADNAISDLRSIVEDTQVEGKLDEAERDMLEAVVEFRSTSVEQIMTPRTEINALEYTDDLAEVQRFVDEHGHSRHPVYSENLDHIEGMLYAKDLLKWIIHHGNNGKPFVLSEILREPTFVPETKTVRELLTGLLADQVHIAIILDEYGGTSGLVTVEDIVEEIFGEIQDEYEDPEQNASAIILDEENKSAQIDARTEIDDANDQLEPIGITLPESDDYDTVGGFVNTALGRIPAQGESFEHESLRFEILEAEPTRVLRLEVSAVQSQDPTQQAEE